MFTVLMSLPSLPRDVDVCLIFSLLILPPIQSHSERMYAIRPANKRFWRISMIFLLKFRPEYDSMI
jgi:hypothetical protein